MKHIVTVTHDLETGAISVEVDGFEESLVALGMLAYALQMTATGITNEETKK